MKDENKYEQVCKDLRQVEQFLRSNGLMALASSVQMAQLHLYSYGAPSQRTPAALDRNSTKET